MRILAIDTSNQPMSVALMDDLGIAAEKITNVKRNHSVQLMPAVETMMEEIGWGMTDLDCIAVAKGPGSYTGVRIGVTVAKSLAWAAEVDLVGISSLKVLAGNTTQQKGGLVAPLFDARRGNIYTSLYRVNKELTFDQVEEGTHVSAEKWAQHLASLKEPIELIGQDVIKHNQLFHQMLKENRLVGSKNRQIPRASVLAEMAESETPVNVHTFVPEYIKLAEAEENWKEAHPGHEGGDFVEKI